MSGSTEHRSVTFVESVEKFQEAPGAPVDIGFDGHAAVFYLERNHPCFQAWLGMLKKSHDDHSTIVFTHSAAGSRITSLEPAPRLVGIVDEIFGKFEGAHAGFAIPRYNNIFRVHGDDKQFESWLELLRQSHHRHTKVIFTYDAFNRRVTSLALAEE